MFSVCYWRVTATTGVKAGKASRAPMVRPFHTRLRSADRHKQADTRHLIGMVQMLVGRAVAAGDGTDVVGGMKDAQAKQHAWAAQCSILQAFAQGRGHLCSPPHASALPAYTRSHTTHHRSPLRPLRFLAHQCRCSSGYKFIRGWRSAVCGACWTAAARPPWWLCLPAAEAPVAHNAGVARALIHPAGLRVGHRGTSR